MAKGKGGVVPLVLLPCKWEGWGQGSLALAHLFPAHTAAWSKRGARGGVPLYPFPHVATRPRGKGRDCANGEKGWRSVQDRGKRRGGTYPQAPPLCKWEGRGQGEREGGCPRAHPFCANGQCGQREREGPEEMGRRGGGDGGRPLSQMGSGGDEGATGMGGGRGHPAHLILYESGGQQEEGGGRGGFKDWTSVHFKLSESWAYRLKKDWKPDWTVTDEDSTPVTVIQVINLQSDSVSGLGKLVKTSYRPDFSSLDI
ncbi:hypothetical protein EDB84DRAFT_1447295 [Lactarius hengduanensis]|nr:hypothetical protein EDB84DRAFT_1447295 [Lactarius hengduanensis]